MKGSRILTFFGLLLGLCLISSFDSTGSERFSDLSQYVQMDAVKDVDLTVDVVKSVDGLAPNSVVIYAFGVYPVPDVVESSEDIISLARGGRDPPGGVEKAVTNLTFSHKNSLT